MLPGTDIVILSPYRMEARFTQLMARIINSYGRELLRIQNAATVLPLASLPMTIFRISSLSSAKGNGPIAMEHYRLCWMVKMGELLIWIQLDAQDFRRRSYTI